ncbi:senescence-associated protein OSA15, chloroplastic isoform X1 [Brachypodium distachyon]|uniref:senescence-associated protein OSA15, chloroplastic isoform X1 n=1 Tax=Brachypodium distachyon TaxID=15368 RepID=UPI0001C73417|nr:senescence-associated protein OSA15, chloroplastic isoform X1 [Brachypodium distachyon]XP_010234156.1 senescence-associated protein OSA15, chloroplastic isoform X1 [Brachypodium distachyon]|eukprot:XP_010234155.1 senescence-associated protein OSA15, chloroplastic isoform X1 [Brachypodium distachyon]
MASQLSGTIASSGMCYDQHGMPCKLKGLHHVALNCTPQKVEVRKWMDGYHLVFRFCPADRHGQIEGKANVSLLRHGQNVRCYSYRSHSSSETKECKSSEDGNDPYSFCRDFEERTRGNSQLSDNQAAQKKSFYSSRGLSEACQFVYNDAKFVNQRAQSDILLLSRGITRLNKRACQDVAVLGLGFLKLDARARKDTQKIDNSVKERAAHLTNFARILKERAQSDLKKAADQHWSDGALEADLRRADLVVRRRAMEDAFMALKFVRDIHDLMANKLQEQLPKDGSFSPTNSTRFITLEKNGKILELFPHEVSTDQITAIEDAYQSMASALSEADGIDYTDPEELELLVAALIDLDAMDGKKSVSLIAECSSSPDVNTRKALANALAAAPSMWTLGNAGMGALQRLAQDSNYAVARSAARAIDELRKQWELEEGDSLRFVVNQNMASEEADDGSSAADDAT